MAEIVYNNNKELIPLEHYLEQFAAADPEEISRRTAVPYETGSQTFRACFLGREYLIHWPDFAIRTADEDPLYAPLTETNQCKILMVRFLLEGSKAVSSDKYLTYREVPWGELYYRQFSGRCLSRLAFSYGNKLEVFREKMERAKAVPVKQSDAGYEFEIFPGYKTQFLIWEGDEDFPPSAQILFSDNFVAGFHPEDLVVVSEIMINALKKI